MSSYNECVASRLQGLENTTYKAEEVMWDWSAGCVKYQLCDIGQVIQILWASDPASKTWNLSNVLTRLW